MSICGLSVVRRQFAVLNGLLTTSKRQLTTDKDEEFMKVIVSIVLILFTGLTVSGPSYGGEISIPGLIEAWAQATMKVKVSGTIGSIHMEEGQRVKEGDLLLELQNEREKAMLQLAEAKVNKARASLLEVQVLLENSRKDLERKELMKEVISQKEYENARDKVLQSEAIFKIKEGELKEAEAELQLRIVELENTQLRAPFDGMITEIPIKKGETVAALQTSICDVVQLDKLYVQVAVPLQLLPTLEKGMKVWVKVEKEVFPSLKRLVGEISYINPMVDPTSRRFKVKVSLGNPHPWIRPGMTAEVLIPLSSKR